MTHNFLHAESFSSSSHALCWYYDITIGSTAAGKRVFKIFCGGNFEVTIGEYFFGLV